MASRDAGAGFTLIELTVVLAVIVTLALVLTPSVLNYINDSRTARARNDTQIVSAALIQFYRDNGFFPQWSQTTAGGPGTAQAEVDLLVSPGNVPGAPAPNLWTTGSAAGLEGQLVSNAPGYTMRSATAPFGWNGPYVSNAIGADPWGNRYMVNIGLIDTTQGVLTNRGQTKQAVWVLSAGPNGIVDTAPAQPITSATLGGDDIGIRLQ